ncbi:hypothetical protein G9A89_001651 [Geosiphon pyriformis]|nr:hypothetical protein G9A89_001651 [Geosiphon pyriformis]
MSREDLPNITLAISESADIKGVSKAYLVRNSLSATNDEELSASTTTTYKQYENYRCSPAHEVNTCNQYEIACVHQLMK